MPIIVGVQFNKAGKVYYFSPQNIEFEVGDGVVVETARGVEYGTVAISNKQVDDKKIVGSLKPVLRKATADDQKQHQSNLEKKANAFNEAREKIKKHNLDMKLIDVEYAFDNSKIIFYFTAENRVDFRDLVKDLAGIFRNRIELRQIGIRDECKLKGGLGPCGRACCCNSCLADFERVSIKMAKNQGLSLSPTKISGLCGRLMCCLKFEDEYYAETLKFMPKVGWEIKTPDGKGTVEAVDILKQNVKVKIIQKNGDVEIKEFNIKQLDLAPAQAEVEQQNDDTNDEVAEILE